MSATQTIFAKARENLNAARLCHHEKFYNATANRTYYACAQVAYALLKQFGKAPEKPNHHKVLSAFGKLYNPNQPTLPSILLKLRSYRETADYTETNINKHQAHNCLAIADEFFSQLQPQTKHL